MEDYLYTALSSPTSIRFLKLHISKTEDTSTTSYSLEEVNLQEDREYEALSYTWQHAISYDTATQTYQWTPTEECHIQIGSTGVLRITRNLSDLLDNLAERAPLGDSVRTVWADQVCMNQSDVQERNSQVEMMKDIYAKAKNTLIWLGKLDDDMLVVSDILEAVVASEYRQQQPGKYPQELVEEIKKVIFYKSGRYWPSNSDFVRSIINTLNKAWFSRAWIIQEAALSREPLFIFGLKAFSVTALNSSILVAALVETKASSFREILHSKILLSRGAQTISHIEACREKLEGCASTELRFLDILVLTLALDASNPRDRVYAFLAFQEPIGEQIVPDYSLGTNDVYTTVSASIANSTNSLSILGLVRGTQSPEFLPSWVVDWRVRRGTQGKPFDTCMIGRKRQFDACRGYSYKSAEDLSASKSLPVRGKKISDVTTVSSVTHHELLPLNQNFKIDKVLDYAKLHLVQGKHMALTEDQDTLFKRILAVLTAQEMSVFGSESERENTVDVKLRGYQNYDRIINKDIALGDYSDLVKAGKALEPLAFGQQKRIFYSGSGLFGLGPEHLKENDSICILHGSTVPVALREQDEGFTVVGQCYYENWMHGDLVDWGEDEGDLFNLV